MNGCSFLVMSIVIGCVIGVIGTMVGSPVLGTIVVAAAVFGLFAMSRAGRY